jgi:hypothetical protein
MSQHPRQGIVPRVQLPDVLSNLKKFPRPKTVQMRPSIKNSLKEKRDKGEKKRRLKGWARKQPGYLGAEGSLLPPYALTYCFFDLRYSTTTGRLARGPSQQGDLDREWWLWQDEQLLES